MLGVFVGGGGDGGGVGGWESSGAVGSELFYYSSSLACVPLVLTNVPKAPGITESITQPENQALILAPFPTSLAILGSWLSLSLPGLLSCPKDVLGLIGIVHAAWDHACGTHEQ